MAKKASKKSAVSQPKSPIVQGAGIHGIFDAMRHKTGSKRMQAGDNGIIIGIPIPSLVVRYLLQSTVLPLGKIWHLAGEEGSCKSAFLYEMMRWHYMAGGGVALAQNENKDSQELRRSIMQHNPIWNQRFIKDDTASMEEWQAFISAAMASTVAEYERKGSPGATWPLLLGIDSLTATAPESEIEGISAEGYATRGFALMANLISRYMRFMPGQVMDNPFTVVGTNHLKPGTDQRGLPKDAVPGGMSVKFMETYEFKMKRIADIEKAKYSGITIEFTTKKNSLGPSRKKASADLIWWSGKAPDGTVRQETAWDWDTAAVNLLLSFENAKGKKGLYKELQAVCDIKVVSRTQKKAYSSELNIPKESPVGYRAIGAKLEQRPDLLDKLYPLLGIAIRPVWDQSVPFLVAVNREAQRMELETASAVQAGLDSGVPFAAPTMPDMEDADG
jgi:RecA/RadA recombinase